MYAELDEEEKKKADRDPEAARKVYVCKTLSKEHNPAMTGALDRAGGGTDLLAQPLKVVTRGVSVGLPLIRDALIDVVDNWKRFFDGQVPPCTVHYDQATRERHKIEMDKLLTSEAVVHLLEKKIGAHPSSFVEMDEFEKAKQDHEKVKKEIAQNWDVSQEEKEALLRDWPIQDGKDPMSSEICQ